MMDRANLVYCVEVTRQGFAHREFCPLVFLSPCPLIILFVVISSELE